MNPISIDLRIMPLEQLQPAEYNPRQQLKPTDSAYQKLKRSLEEFGLVEPLIWNEKTRHIVGGHLRLRILKELDFTDIPVSVVQLSEAREKALNVILNNREAQGKFDPVRLRDLLQELEPLPEMDLTGFDSHDLANLQFDPLEELPPLPEQDRVELTLIMTKEIYRSAADKLDALIREYDLESHVKGN